MTTETKPNNAPTVDKAHARFGPSTLKYRAACVHWRPDPHSDTAAADEGTLLHAALETDNPNGLDEEQLDVYVFCKSIERDYDEEAKSHGEYTKLKEVRLSILNDKTFGTADLVYKFGQFARIVDWKCGRRSIDPSEENWQGIAYMIGVFELYPDVDEVEVVFVSPRRDEVQKHTFLRSDLWKHQWEVGHLLDRCERGDGPYNPTRSGCEFCLKTHCKAMNGLAIKTATEYESLTLPEEFHPSKIETPEQMAVALDLAPILEKWVKSVKKHAKDMYESGTMIPGYVQRTKAGARNVNDPLLAYEVVKEFLTPEQFIDCCNVQITKLEKWFAEEGRETGAFKTKKDALAFLSTKLSNVGAINYADDVEYLAKQK